MIATQTVHHCPIQCLAYVMAGSTTVWGHNFCFPYHNVLPLCCGPGAHHFHNLGHGGPPHNGVVHQQHALAVKHSRHGIQLPPNTQLPHPAPKHASPFIPSPTSPIHICTLPPCFNTCCLSYPHKIMCCFRTHALCARTRPWFCWKCLKCLRWMACTLVETWEGMLTWEMSALRVIGLAFGRA